MLGFLCHHNIGFQSKSGQDVYLQLCNKYPDLSLSLEQVYYME